VVAISYSQAGQLFLEAMSPSLPAPLLVRCFLVDELDRAVLEQALRAITRRHSSLRTGFCVAPQIVPRSDPRDATPQVPPAQSLRIKTWVAADVPIAVQTLTPGNGQITLDQALDAAELEANRRFALDQPPLMRMLFARVGTNEHLLVMMLHHLIADRWSLDILEHELFVAYRGFKRDDACPSSPLPMQYSEFAHIERERLKGGTLNHSVEFWKREWDAYGSAQLTVADFPFGRAAAAERFDVAVERVVLNLAAMKNMASFARRRRQSVHMLALTAFAAALRQATGKEKIAVFGTFANRTSVAAEAAVGWFANAHLLGVSCSPDTSLERLADNTRRAVLAAFEHQAVPPGYLWATGNAGPFRSDAWVSFDYVSRRVTDRGASPRVEIVAPRPLPGHIGLRVFAMEMTDGLHLTALHSREKFDGAGVAALLRTMTRLMELTLADGTLRLGDAERLTTAAAQEADRAVVPRANGQPQVGAPC
jgi:hypothetical protein